MTVEADPDLELEWWLRVSWIVFVAVGIWVAVQRWDQPDAGRNLALLVLGTLPIVIDELFAARVPWFARIPRAVWSAPLILVVLVLVWHPTTADFAPCLLLLLIIRAEMRSGTVDGLVVLAASSAVMIFAEAAGHFSGSANWVLGFVLAWSGSFVVRALLLTLSELRAAQADLATRAAADERQRIARENHDVTAHTLSVAALHITGARMAVERNRPDAVHALEEAERLTRESLAQVRSVVGMLSPTVDGTAAAMPTAADIPALVQEYTAAGVDVDLDVEGDLEGLSSTIGLSLYRVTQESLSNVAQHAPGGTVRVRIVVGADAIELDVSNPLRGAVPDRPWGRGLHGMQDRSHAHSGTFDAGPVDDEWHVRMAIPAEAARS